MAEDTTEASGRTSAALSGEEEGRTPVARALFSRMRTGPFRLAINGRAASLWLT